MFCGRLFLCEAPPPFPASSASHPLSPLCPPPLPRYLTRPAPQLEDVRLIPFDIVCPLDSESQAVAEKMDWKGGKVGCPPWEHAVLCLPMEIAL